jgi:hypothetical protein
VADHDHYLTIGDFAEILTDAVRVRLDTDRVMHPEDLAYAFSSVAETVGVALSLRRAQAADKPVVAVDAAAVDALGRLGKQLDSQRFEVGDLVEIGEGCPLGDDRFVGFKARIVSLDRVRDGHVLLKPTTDRPDGFKKSKFVWNLSDVTLVERAA